MSFSMIGEQWMLVTAGTAERCNTMTASWGGLGVLWGKPVATVYIRPQRYTLEFVEREDCFTLSFFGEEYRKALALCGSKSGRDVDKVKECGFTVAGAACGAPYFEEAGLVLVCKKAYWAGHGPDPLPGRRAGREVVPRKGLPPHLHRGDCGSAEEKLTPGLRPAARRTV